MKRVFMFSWRSPPRDRSRPLRSDVIGTYLLNATLLVFLLYSIIASLGLGHINAR
jgi:hypothetical protein